MLTNRLKWEGRCCWRLRWAVCDHGANAGETVARTPSGDGNFRWLRTEERGGGQSCGVWGGDERCYSEKAAAWGPPWAARYLGRRMT